MANKEKKRNNKYLFFNVSVMEKYLRNETKLPESDKTLIILLITLQSHSGMNIYTDDELRAKLPYDKSTFYKSSGRLLDKGIIERDIFGNLFIPELLRKEKSSFLCSVKNFRDYLADKTAENPSKVFLGSPCIEFLGKQSEKKYGYVRVGRFLIGIHRFVWEQEYGKIKLAKKAKNRKVVHHRCENPLCCNVKHLVVLPKHLHDKIHRK